MTVYIGKIDDSDNDYFAYVKIWPRNNGTFFVHITDDIIGAITLNDFLEMLRKHFKVDAIILELLDHNIKLKSNYFLELIKSGKK